MTANSNIHPFTGFGPAPYRIIRVTEKVHAPPGEYPRAGGSCDHCGASIRWAYRVRCADSVEFEVGCDCAAKAGMSLQEIKDARRAYRHERFNEASRLARAEREAAERGANKDRYGYALTNEEYTQAFRQGQAAARSWKRLERKYHAQHVGIEGKRSRGLELLVERTHSFETIYGLKTIWIMRDRANNQLVWKSTAYLGMYDASGKWHHVRNERDGARMSRWFRCDATVKEHSEYDGMRQTEIQRVKVTEVTPDWIDLQES